MKNKVLSSIKKYNMLSYSDTVYVGVSGGADSMCLLSVLCELKDELSLTVIAVHINHCIRGVEADNDEEYVKNYCIINNIHFISKRINIPEESKLSGESTELCARRLRYKFFEEISQNGKIATAHNLNDCEETYFLNTIRGTGLGGLIGIPPVRGKIIRPLIEISRTEIEEYCNSHNINFRTDSTNFSDDYSRNRIRHNIIPICKEINNSFDDIFLRNQISLKNDFDFISKYVDENYFKVYDNNRLIINKLTDLHISVRYRIISRFIFDNINFVPEYKHIVIIDNFLKDGGAVDIKDKIIFESDKVYLKLRKQDYNKKDCHIALSDKLLYYHNGNEIKLEISDFCIDNPSKQKTEKLCYDNYCDYERLIKNSVLRFRIDGDKFRQPFSHITKKLKNLFNEKNIPPEERNNLYIIADNDNILWIEGIGFSDYCRINKNTKKICKITLRRNKNA